MSVSGGGGGGGDSYTAPVWTSVIFSAGNFVVDWVSTAGTSTPDAPSAYKYRLEGKTLQVQLWGEWLISTHDAADLNIKIPGGYKPAMNATVGAVGAHPDTGAEMFEVIALYNNTWMTIQRLGSLKFVANAQKYLYSFTITMEIQ